MGRFLTILLSLLCIIMSNKIAIAQNADVKGWGKTTWGMSEGEINKLYPEAKRFKDNILNISDIVIGTHKYDVTFIFDPQCNKLIDVIVGVPRGKPISGTQFSELEKELTIKYGHPAYRNERPTVAKEIVTIWTFPSTTIELKYVLMRSQALNTADYQSIIIRYRPNIARDNL
jgi:hypothetical protein